jgi:hypothetical protein
MNKILEIRVNWTNIIPYLLDVFIEIGVGIVLLVMAKGNSILFWIGLFLTIFGVVQLIRKIKTFHLSKSRLLIKRSLMPFKFAEVDFELEKVKKIEFKRLVRVGPYIRIIGRIDGKDGGFMLAMDKKSIDSFEKELRLLDLTVSRENI